MAEVSMAKHFVANMLGRVIDRSIQVHGALGYSTDTPLAHMYQQARMIGVVEDLPAEIGEVMPSHVRPALVEVEQPHLIVGADPDVAGHRVAVDDRYRHRSDRGEYGENVTCNVIGKFAHVRIDARAGSSQLRHSAAPRPLRMVGCGAVQSL